jgi:cytochrome c oxidase assembly factor CtaG
MAVGLSVMNFIALLVLFGVTMYLVVQIVKLNNDNDDNKNILLNLQNMVNHNFWTVSKHVPGIKKMN